MTGRDKFIVDTLIGLLVATSAAAIALDQGALARDPANGGTYVEGVAGFPQYLNPVIAGTTVDQDVARLAFSGLTRYDQNGAIVRDLAADFRTESEGRVWTFDIRDDAAWQDGEPVTADDVVYTVKLLQDRGYVGPYGDAFRGVSVERVGPRTVRFTLPDVYSPFADSTTVPLLPAHLLGGVSYGELARQPFNVRPVGTGPFRVSGVDGRQIVLTRNDAFYRTRPARSRPYVDRVILRFYPDSTEALFALSRGEIDGLAGLSSQDAARARTLKNVVLYSLPTDNFVALFLNVRPSKLVFRERAVRQAIAMAIDRGRVLQSAADGSGAVADEFVPASSWAYARDVTRYQFSPQEGDRAPRHMGFQKQVRVVGALRQPIELVRQLVRGLELPPPRVKPVQTQQRPEALGRLVHLPAQGVRPGIGPLDLWRRMPLAGMERQPQGELEAKLVPVALGGRRQTFEDLQPRGEVTGGFDIGGAFECPLSGPLPVVHRRLVAPCLGIVVCQQFRLGDHRVGKLRL